MPGWGPDSGGWSGVGAPGRRGARLVGEGGREGKPPPSSFVSPRFRAQVSRHGNACGRAGGTGGGGGALRGWVGVAETGRDPERRRDIQRPGAQPRAPRPAPRTEGLPRPIPGGGEALSPDPGPPGPGGGGGGGGGRGGERAGAAAPDKEPPPLAPQLGRGCGV